MNSWLNIACSSTGWATKGMIAKGKDNAEERFPIVDPEGHIVGEATRGECHSGSHLLHPVVHLHVLRPDGALFLQHRPAWKDIQPDRWDTAVGGHVDLGEDIETALRREAREELGLTDFEPEMLLRYVFRSDRESELVHVFRIVTDATPCPSDELDGGRFFTFEEIDQRLDTGFFTPNFEQELQRIRPLL